MARKVTAKQVERKLLALLEKALPAARSIKLNGVAARRNWPDQLVILPGGSCAFIVVRQPGGPLTKLQHRVIAELQLLGHRVSIGDDPNELVSEIIRALSSVSRG
jgi:hypothetical protein